MSWLLTILMIMADGTAVQTEVGVMANEPICDIAGQGFAAVLQAETPGMIVAWSCERMGVSV
jgi:hypothetical protein